MLFSRGPTAPLWRDHHEYRWYFAEQRPKVRGERLTSGSYGPSADTMQGVTGLASASGIWRTTVGPDGAATHGIGFGGHPAGEAIRCIGTLLMQAQVAPTVRSAKTWPASYADPILTHLRTRATTAAPGGARSPPSTRAPSAPRASPRPTAAPSAV